MVIVPLAGNVTPAMGISRYFSQTGSYKLLMVA
jgi:hypothetical protein